MAEDEKGAEGAEKDGNAESGLVAKNKELLGELKAVKAKLKELGGGFDIEAAREALEFKERADEEMAKKAGEFEKLRAKDREKYERDLRAKEAREAKLASALSRRLVENELMRALKDAGGDPKYLIPVAKDRVKAVEGEDDWETVVYDAKGQPSSMDALMKELKVEFPRAFDGTGSSGSGALAGGGGGGGVPLPDPHDPVAVGRAADAWLRQNRK